jgi:hypothetical protein
MAGEIVDLQIKGQNMNESDTMSAQSVEGQLASAKLNEKNLKRELEEANEEI